MAEKAPTDPGLAEVIDAWPKLPEPVKAGIVAMLMALFIVGLAREYTR